MNFMIRLASVVSLVTFWLAAIVWTVLIVAAPANAAPSTEHGAVSTSTSAPAGAAGKSERLSPADAAKSDHHMEVEKYVDSPEGQQEREKKEAPEKVVGPGGL